MNEVVELIRHTHLHGKRGKNMRIYHQASWVPWPFGTSRPKFPPMIQSPRSGSTPCNTKEVEKQKFRKMTA